MIPHVVMERIVLASGETGVPERNFLVPLERSPGEERVFVSGHVTDLDCVHLKCAEIEVWGASKDGEYDAATETFWGRGRLKVDETGAYNYTTTIPGRYRLGNSFRPSHIHMKVIVPGVPTLTTQLYFEEDPFLGKNDPCGKTCNSGDDTLIMPKTYINGEWNVNFDIHMNTRAAWLPVKSCRAITDDEEEIVMNDDAAAQEVYDEDTVVDGNQDIKEDKSWYEAKNGAVCYRKCLTDEHSSQSLIIPSTPNGEKKLKLYCKVACGRGEFSGDDRITLTIKRNAWAPRTEERSINEATNDLLEIYNELKQQERIVDMSWLEAKNSAVCYRKCLENGEHPWLIIPSTPLGLKSFWTYCKLACGRHRQTEAGFVNIKGRELSGDDLSTSIKDEARRGGREGFSQNGQEPEPLSVTKVNQHLFDDFPTMGNGR